MNHNGLFKTWLLILMGVLFASNILPGIHYQSLHALLLAALLLSLCNVFLKPLLMLFALPFIILTFGLGIWFINAWLFLLVSGLVEGFTVNSFSSALVGAFIVSLTGWMATIIFMPNEKGRVRVHFGRRGGVKNRPMSTDPKSSSHKLDGDDVIDI